MNKDILRAFLIGNLIGITCLIAVVVMTSQSKQEEAASSVSVTVRDVSSGSVITQDDITIEKRDPSQSPARVLRDASAILGKKAARAINKGTVITEEDVLR